MDLETLEVEALVEGERLREAAALCQARGQVDRAIDLLERAAAFEEAARLGAEHGQAARALRLVAAFGGDALLAEVAARLTEAEALGLGYDLGARSLWRASAHAFRRAGRGVEEGEAWERSGELLEAALAYRRGNEALRAARALTARLAERPGDARASLELGRLLLDNGKLEAAAKALQGVAPEADEAPRARALLARVFERLGLREARASLGDVEEIAAEPEGPKAEGLLYGRYQVQKLVATTPTARVFACRDRLTDQAVAVKVLRLGAGGLEGRDAIQRFAREAQALALLRHPHIVPLSAFVPEGPAVVTPWMSGGSLADVLSTTALSPDRAVEIARAMLSALGDAHRLGILHRDVKPSNVLVDGAGAPYLADFGAAHVSDTATTVTAGLIGSLAYLAPELLVGGKASVASDLYGVGAVLYEALTGERPTPADEVQVWPSQVSAELGKAHDELVGKLIARDPARRPATAREAAEALAALSFRVTAPARKAAKAGPTVAAGKGRRLVPLDDSAAFDTVLRRRVRLLPATEATLRLGRATAQAQADALAAVYRLDAQAGALWVEDVAGVPLGQAGRPLSAAEALALGQALGELHRRGAAHGHVDPEHVRFDGERGVVLAFPAQPADEATADGDLAALAALGAEEA